MRILPIDRTEPGAVLARHVYSGEAILLAAGTRMTPRLLEQLRSDGVRTLYMFEPEDQYHQTDRQPDLVTQRTRAGAARVLRELVAQMGRLTQPSAQPLSEAVNLILDEVWSHRAALLEFGEIRATEGYVLGHSVHVSATAAYLAIHMGLDSRDLKALAVGAILHDVGKARVTQGIWDKPGSLSLDEFGQMRQHAMFGFDMIRACQDLGLCSAHVAAQHHERWDGQGYPRGLAGEKIHLFARIVAVADVSDALITDRPYRPAWTRHQALEYIQDQAGAIFDPAVVRAFVARVAPYPVRTLVRLNTGERARVVRLNTRSPARPVIEIVDSGEELDLKRVLSRRIVGPVDETSSNGPLPGDLLPRRGGPCRGDG